MRIEMARCADLPAHEWNLLESIAEAEFDQYALVRETEWAQPDWCFRAFDGEALAVFYNIILRTVRIDAEPVRIAGLNNMITLANYRGRGLASQVLRQTQLGWMSRFDADCGMLLCADPLVPFYSKLGWAGTEARVVYQQPSGPKTWPANCMVMGDARYAAARDIDLCGLPW